MTEAPKRKAGRPKKQPGDPKGNYNRSRSTKNVQRIVKNQIKTAQKRSKKLKQLDSALNKKQVLTDDLIRSEEHTSELQSPVPISYAVFCLKKKK